MQFFLYPAKVNKSLNYNDSLVIFWTYQFGSSIPPKYLHDLRDLIKDYLNNHLPFDNIFLVTHNKNWNHFKDITGFFEEYNLAYSLKISDTNIYKVLFNDLGLGTVNDDETKFKQYQDIIIFSGLSFLFNNRGAMVGPTDHIHYILPSRNHSNVFIRIANILKRGVEINFVGFVLLKYLTNNIKNIYCDTSSITSAAQAAVNLKLILDPIFVAPNIDSFGSYYGIDNYNFIDPSNSIFLISVSSDGRLSSKLFNKIGLQTSDDNIIIMYKYPSNISGSISPIQSKGRALCYLNEIIAADVIDSIITFESDCKLCSSNSTPVEIIGDEFMTEKEETISILLKEEYLPIWFSNVASILIGKKYIVCHRLKRKTQDSIREIYLDIDALFRQLNLKKNKYFNKLFQKYLIQRVSASLKIIIYLDDTASKTIAECNTPHFLDQKVYLLS